MSRSLFDPSRMASRPPGDGGGAEPPAPVPAGKGNAPAPLSVSQLAGMIDGVLREHLPRRVRVVGEVSGFNDRTHWYFSLKDADAVVSCVMFASAARAAGFRPENGQEVVATGRVEFFGKQGRTQFYVERLEPVGAGALDVQFKKLCEELRGLGWFAPERKRPLPRFPRRVCVITSRTSAAYQDVLNTFNKRAPCVEIALVDVRVQGDGAAAQVAAAVRRAGARHAELGFDAILLTRGGGSKEDLWTFNERVVAEAIVKCPIPVVAAIGHETDVTIAELVADERCATPTQAAMRLSPDLRALAEQVHAGAERMRYAMERAVRRAAEQMGDTARHVAAVVRSRAHADASRMERVAAGIERHRPAALHARRQAALDTAAARLAAVMRTRLDTADAASPADGLRRAARALVERAGLLSDARERALELVGPPSVLARGFSVTLGPDGLAIRSATAIQPGSVIRTVVQDGSFESTVGGTPQAGTEIGAVGRIVGPRARRKGPPPSGPSLFDGGENVRS